MHYNAASQISLNTEHLQDNEPLKGGYEKMAFMEGIFIHVVHLYILIWLTMASTAMVT